MKTIQATSIQEIQHTVTEAKRVFPRGNSSKHALAAHLDLEEPSGYTEELTVVETSALAGILEYQPSEYTFTALAGTTISTVSETLAAEGQYLPFEPPFDQSSATLGGTVAAGLSGAGRYRYGGVRDFLIGVRFVDGQGDVVMGGGKVVKNAAGFDSPKLMVGSLGRLGIIVELSFKVFPAPKVYRTLRLVYPDLDAALGGLNKLAVAPMDMDAVELLPQSSGSDVHLLVRIGGLENTLYARLGRFEDLLIEGEIVDLAGETQLWEDLRNFAWAPAEAALVKIPTSPNRIAALDQLLSANGAARVYSGGGHLCWAAWPAPIAQLDIALREQEFSGLILQLGDNERERAAPLPDDFPYVGIRKGVEFGRRIQRGIDPEGRFLPV